MPRPVIVKCACPCKAGIDGMILKTDEPMGAGLGGGLGFAASSCCHIAACSASC
jgi:hypothetical protein